MRDKKTYDLIKNEEVRQEEDIGLIPSENYASIHVRKALASVLTNKYSEGYPNKRYYGGNMIVDKIEILAQERAKKLFDVPYVNVQPYSGSPANFAVYMATCKPGDTIMGLNLPDGGHLTHGWKVSASAQFYKSVPYHVNKYGQIDFNEVRKLARKHKPKLIWAGATAYVHKYNYRTFAEIADEIGAFFAADVAHVAGLIIGKVHPDPAQYAHIITTTTHKTLRGPRGAMIMTTKRGLEKDAELARKIDKAVFPGLQGGPHDNQTAAIAIALYEASKPPFKTYTKQIIDNAKTLADTLKKGNLTLVGNGTENHMILIDLTKTHGIGVGTVAEKALELVGLIVNKNTIPGEKSSPFYPSGIRIGTPAVTTRGMKEKQIIIISNTIVKILDLIRKYKLPPQKSARKEYVKKMALELSSNTQIQRLHSRTIRLAKQYPIP